MSEKFNIATGMDLDKLNDRVYQYEKKATERPYMFISSATARAAFPYHRWAQSAASYNKIGGLYSGCKVFMDEGMGFGEVELR